MKKLSKSEMKAVIGGVTSPSCSVSLECGNGTSVTCSGSDCQMGETEIKCNGTSYDCDSF